MVAAGLPAGRQGLLRKTAAEVWVAVNEELVFSSDLLIV